jgi:predicted amino acid racemase
LCGALQEVSVPELLVDAGVIKTNAEAVAALLRTRGLDLVAVTKGCLGDPRVAMAMLAGGAIAVADTRDVNLRGLRAALPNAELHRINLPPVAGSFEPGDVTYVTSWAGAAAVARLAGVGEAPGAAAAGARGAAGALVPRRVMLQVETGDQREGVPLEEAVQLAGRIASDPRLELEGVATNYACFEGEPEGIRASVEAVARVARELRAAGLPVHRVSGGNSSLLWLVARGEALPEEVTELRCGEALLLGHDALHYEPLPGCRDDACVIRAEVVEEYTRPSPGGAARRLLLGVGRQDLGTGSVKFAEPGLREIGRSSDYLVLQAKAGSASVPVGEMVDMIPGYEALVAAWTSPYVDTRVSGFESAEVGS